MRRLFSIPTLAVSWDCSQDHILTLIHNGTLRAVNLAATTSGRPRWAVPLAEVERLEKARESGPVVKAKRRKPQEDYERIFS